MAIDPDLPLHRTCRRPEHPGMGGRRRPIAPARADFATKAAGGPEILASRGAIRLSGDGVHGNAISMSGGRRVPDPLAGSLVTSAPHWKGNKPDPLSAPDEIIVAHQPGAGRLARTRLLVVPGVLARCLHRSRERYPGGEPHIRGVPAASCPASRRGCTRRQ